METYEYETLFQTEDVHWWFRGLRDVLIWLVKSLNLPARARVLDMGCGTGATVKSIAGSFSFDVFGFDGSEAALPFLKKRGIQKVGVGSINRTPCKNEAFNLVLCIDVLECQSVDEMDAVEELWRVLKPSGFLILLVPAYRWLQTPEHHAAVHAVRRYNPWQVRALLDGRFQIKRLTHLFFILFPLVMVYRLILRLKSRNRVFEHPRSELRMFPAFLNRCLSQVVSFEGLFLPWMNFPWGSSILVLAQKKAL